MRLIDADAAYDILTAYYHQRTEFQHMALREALDRVPTAEPCNDAISRQAAIDAVTKYCLKYDLRELLADIECLPTAETEIIKCRECLMHGVCRFEQGLGLDGYCSQAERKSDGRPYQQTGGD